MTLQTRTRRATGLWLIPLPMLLAPYSLFGAAIQVNGTCQFGNCVSPDIVATGGAVTTPFSFVFTLSNTDQYQIAGSAMASNVSGLVFSLPYSVTYLGNALGTGSGMDVLTIDALQNFAFTSTSGTFFETLRGGFAGPLSAGSAAQGKLSIGGQALSTQGPFSPPGSFNTTSSGVALSGLGNPLLFDQQRVLTFGAGSGVGASISNGAVPTVPEPGSLALLSTGIFALAILSRKNRGLHNSVPRKITLAIVK